MTWIAIVGAMLLVMTLLAFVARARRQQVPVAPLVELRLGVFDKLALVRLPQPDAALSAVSAVEHGRLRAGTQREQERSVEHSPTGIGAVAPWGVVLADGMAPAISVWERWNSVDHQIFQAFSHLAGEQVDGIADLLHLVDAKGYAIESAGFAQKLLGHVGEWHAFEHFSSASVDVAIPEASNAPGLDLLADGQPLNVKTVGDAASAAYSHFHDYPDIPIVVPADAANIPVDALHFDPSAGFDAASIAGTDHLVIVDHALSHVEVAGQTENALGVLGDPGPHLHFPWVTAAVSGFREARLLVKGHTDLARAAKNVVVDTAAVGGGGAVGMKAGALIGTAFGPVGTVVGGIAGGLLGAIGGRVAANSVKRAPLEAAKTEYEVALKSYRDEEATLVAVTGAKWQRAQDDEGRALQSELGRIRSAFESDLTGFQHHLQRAVLLQRGDAEALLASARERLENTLEEDHAALRACVPRWLWLWSGLFAPAEAQRYSQHRLEYTTWRRKADGLLRQWKDSPVDTSTCFDLAMAVPQGVASAEGHLRHSAAVRRRIIVSVSNRHQQLLAAATERRSGAEGSPQKVDQFRSVTTSDR